MKELYHNPKPGTGYVSVFDLDGCLSDDRWRLGRAFHAIAARESGRHSEADAFWENYHKDSHKDNPNFDVKEILQMDTTRGLEIWIVTARPCKFAQQTQAWLEHNGCLPHRLMMRETGDKSRSRDLKFTFLNGEKGKRCIGYHRIIDNDSAIVTKLRPLGPTYLYHRPQDEF